MARVTILVRDISSSSFEPSNLGSQSLAPRFFYSPIPALDRQHPIRSDGGLQDQLKEDAKLPNFVPLDEVAHADLRALINTSSSQQANVNQTLVFPTEFKMLAREYPIFFRKDEEGRFFAIVLLGLDRGENLYLEGGRWTTHYVPAVIDRGPFALALPQDSPQDTSSQDAQIQIDMDDPQVGVEHGERLFLQHGGQSPYLQLILKVLRRIHVGAAIAGEFFQKLEDFRLIEPLSLQASLDDSLQYTVPDIFTISRERMADLDAEELHHLNQIGLLEHCFSIMSSTDNFCRIVDLKAQKQEGQVKV